MSVLVDYSDDPSVAIPLSSEMIERLRRLAQSYPKTVGTALLDRSMYHGQLLSKFGRLKDAVDWLEGLGAKYHGLASTDAEIGQWYIELLLDLAHMLKDQGAMEKARVVLRRATETGSMHPNIGLVLSCVAKSHEADIVACLGDSSPALNLSTDCLSLALQFYPLHDINIALLQHQHSQLVAVNEIYEEALSNAKDSATIMLNYITDDPAKLDRYRYHWLSEFWRVWASCLSDTNGPAPALILAGQGAKEANRVKAALRKNLYLCKISESYLGLALWTLGSIQLFSRNTDDAQKSLEEAKELWKARVEVRRFDLRNFALTLWALGFTYCLLGRHDDGASVHQELKKMINGLIYAEPTMHRVVKVALDQERRRPSWALFLEKVREELQCKHLMDVVPNAKIE
ncbi:hypothetical protein CPB83DRAFT_848800 [Crepidotus variabilis]|uniref:Uncharacterized protein n=1 Tax=Crepidotus variabilis TaxID=179855 RepID=A0A9P6JSZ6_9AGAR|nr:hypothetical protein CPB83DRAFT_848800 [Crepidotus variabilis]